MKRISSMLLAMALIAALLPHIARAEGDLSATICSGFDYHLAITNDGSLWAWGGNGQGQLGDGTTEDRDLPVKVLDDVQSVSAGFATTMAVKNDGSLWSWGQNHHGQVGSGTVDDYGRAPQTVPVKIMEGVASVSVGHGFFAMILMKDGSLYACGDNTQGEMGIGDLKRSADPTFVTDSVRSVSAGRTHTLIVKRDGSLWACGSNQYDKLGSGGPIVPARAAREPYYIMSGVERAYAGNTFSLILKTDGTLWACGYNLDGQLGDGTHVNQSVPVMVMEDVKDVSVSFATAIVVKSDGTVWGFGRNRYGQDVSFSVDDYAPYKILDDVVAATTGDRQFIYLKPDGSLWEMKNTSVKKTDGTIYANAKPVKVLDGVLLPTGAAPVQVPSAWAVDAALWAADKQELIEKLDGRWQYNITRAEFAAVMVVLTEEIVGRPLPAAPAGTFTDTSDPFVLKAHQAGIVQGVNSTTFNPAGHLTREQLAVMLYRAIAYIEVQTGKIILPTMGSLQGYSDQRLISNWAVEAVTALAVNGIMMGTGATTLSPQDNATIEQALVLALRLRAAVQG